MSDLVETVERTLKPLCETDEGAVAVYRALCNVLWVPEGSPWQSYDEAPISDETIFAVTWRGAGGLVADWRERDEDYLAFYCAGGEGLVADEVREAMATIGLRPVF